MKKILIEEWVFEGLPKKLLEDFPGAFNCVSSEQGFKEDEEISFLVTLGGDGTVLHALRLLGDQNCPPILSFAIVSYSVTLQGSLCYLCHFDMQEY